MTTNHELTAVADEFEEASFKLVSAFRRAVDRIDVLERNQQINREAIQIATEILKPLKKRDEAVCDALDVLGGTV